MTDAADRAAERGSALDGRASPTAACPRRPSPATSSRPAGSARSARCAPRIGRTGSMDAEAPLTWRMQKERAGSGCARRHRRARDRPRPNTSPASSLQSVSGILETIVTERPLLGEGIGLSGTASTRARRGHRRRHRPVHRPARSPAAYSRSDFEATRFRTGRKNALRIEVSGSLGAISFDLERMNELDFYDATLPADRAGLPQDPRHRARSPVPRSMVAGRAHARLRARLLAPGRRLRHRDRRGHAAAPVVRGRAARAARARRRGAQLRRGKRLDLHATEPGNSANTEGELRNDATDHPVHRPVGRPAARGGRTPRLRVGLRRPRDRLLGRPPRPVALG